MNAVIIYDDRKLAGDVNAMLEWAAGHAGGAGSWRVRPWRLDLLAQPRAAEAALGEAAEAHFIVLALRSQAEPPAELLEWLETWAGRRHVRDAAVALFDGGAGYTQPGPATARLSAFADRHGLSFILGDAGPAGQESEAFARRLREREAAELAALAPSFTGAFPAYGRHWGINE